MGLSEKLKDILTWILALLGFGGIMLSTGAWTVPQSGVYASLTSDATWAHINATVSCIWEVHPNTTKTINSVSYNVSGSWTACSQNSNDWLLWTCGSITANASTQACPALRVVQNENPGTSEGIFNANLTTPNITSIPGLSGCLGAETCNTGLYGPWQVAAGTYTYRKLIIGNTLTIQGNVTFIAAENLTITSTGSLSINPGVSNLIFRTLFFSNAGTITSTGTVGSGASCGYMYGECGFGAGPQEQPSCSGATAGQSAADLYFSGVKNLSNSGTITLTGGAGGAGCSWCAPCDVCSTGGGAGGAGGKIYVINSTASIVNTGTINTVAGTGGLGACYSSCSTHSGSLSSSSASGSGGVSGNLFLSLLDLNSTGTFVTDGGSGGASGSGPGSCSYSAGSTGTGGSNTINVSRNITVTNSMSSVNGAWNVAYCANGTGNNWANFNPVATQSALACGVVPAFSFVTPTPTSNYTALQNLTVNLSNSNASIVYVIQYSKDNGSTWQFVTPPRSFPPSYSSNTYNFDTHRNGSDTSQYTRFRAIALNNSSGIYSEWVQVNFNLTDIAANLTQSSTPNGSVVTPSVMFYCNYTNSTGGAIEAATTKVLLDGVLYGATYNSTDGRYYYLNTNVWAAGNHSWNCVMDKANYAAKNGTNTTITLSGYGLFLAGSQTSVKLTCPFPTIYGMTPTGQKAGIGIFRIQNYNTTTNKNYSILLGNTPAAGISIYARCDRFVSNPSNYTNWTLLNTTDFYSCLKNINSTNASAYIWLKMDCVNVVPGNYTPFGYVFQEG